MSTNAADGLAIYRAQQADSNSTAGGAAGLSYYGRCPHCGDSMTTNHTCRSFAGLTKPIWPLDSMDVGQVVVVEFEHGPRYRITREA